MGFDYDDLNRLTGASGIYGSHTYTYDANGNRLTQTIGLATDTYSYVSSTHRLDDIDDGITTQTFGYDNNGNTTSDGAHDLIYGDNNRLATVEVSSTPMAGYVYNGKGERVIKDVIDPILYYYDQNGQLLAELDENGDTIKEYAYLDGQPLAVMSGVEVYNYHNDHLGTPQILTDDNQDVVWAADYEPFGKADITTGTVSNNLRFPGQYFDDETDLHYNYFRDYDPNTGRYVQSDPIGLDGGINTYGYALQNPLRLADPKGLNPLCAALIAIDGPAPIGDIACGCLLITTAIAMNNAMSTNNITSKIEAVTSANECRNSSDSGNSCGGDPCKGLREQLKSHEDKLREFIANPDSQDNKGFLPGASPERRQKIIDGRIRNLQRQIRNFRRMLEECEQQNGMK